MKYTLSALIISILIIHSACIIEKKASSSLRKQDVETSIEVPLKSVTPTLSDFTKEISTTSEGNTPTVINVDSTQSEIQSSTITEVNDINTLVELPISASTSISYYYPYFYKTHLITFADEIDTTILISTCSDIACSYCDPVFTGKCMKCATGFFLAGDSCVSYCPDGFVSDILRLKCIEVATVTTEIVYTKAYSFGSCRNMCGKMVQDCSCSPSCKSRGNCCTDYDVVNCDGIMEKSSKVTAETCSKTDNCEFCDNNLTLGDGNQKCNQCKESYYLLDGRCYSSCPEGTSADVINYVCNKNPVCTVSNCGECSTLSSNSCKTCKRGFFLQNGECLEKCNSGYRADRVTWTCLEPPGM